ncbi:GNAT family N-acetyltransferase [Pseudoalteromonas holothuriae]|uniref:GNAT family N-acetyltransferase n=1 Tax=Pseudoalteromonas holothuriae TaxID=2963714 RepID=UPI003965A63F
MEHELRQHKLTIFTVFHEQALIASAQLVPCRKQNGKHRAEIEKLLVHPEAQRQGLATKLMEAVKQYALTQHIKLL